MKIHILSDLHNDLTPFIPSLAVNEADVIVLAGDIDSKARGVAWARQVFPCPVIYVPGNHEFYGGHLEYTLEKMRAAACDRVRVLDNEQWIFAGVRFLGATGWTDCTSTGNSVLAKYEAQRGLNDYRKIRTVGYRKVRPDDLVLLNHHSRNWLRERLAESFEGATVVVTHHAPSLLSMGYAPIGEKDELARWKVVMGNSAKIGSTSVKPTGPEVPDIAAAYANGWESMMGDSIALWIHGHVHLAVDYTINGTRVICNPRGYPREDTGFNPELLISVKNAENVTLSEDQLDDILRSYAAGKIARRDVEQATGLWFSDILLQLGRRGLPLPTFDTRVHLNERQRAWYDTLFSKLPSGD